MRRRRPGWKRWLLAVPVFLACGGVYLGTLYLTGNFHTVIAGELYRSAQPDAGRLARYVQENGIRTVINLRGANPGARWYQDEIAVSRTLGVTHLDFPMSARRMLTEQQATELIAMMRDAPKPVLIHCRAGSDRTGLATVIYLNRIAGVDEERAEWALSLLYGHIGIPYLSSAYAMDETWEFLEQVFGIEGS